MTSVNVERTGWTSWAVFASVMLSLAGIFQILGGAVALIRGDEYFGDKNGVALNIDYAGWGWWHIIVGAFLLLAAGSLAKGHMYGRILAVLAAMASATTQLLFIGAEPFWSFTVIVIDLLVIWAVTVHGRELRVD